MCVARLGVAQANNCWVRRPAQAVAGSAGAAPLPCGCRSLAECSCLAPAALTTAQQAAQTLAAAHGLDASACPLTGLTLSQIAELKSSPPEALQQAWRSIAQRLA